MWQHGRVNLGSCSDQEVTTDKRETIQEVTVSQGTGTQHAVPMSPPVSLPQLSSSWTLEQRIPESSLSEVRLHALFPEDSGMSTMRESRGYPLVSPTLSWPFLTPSLRGGSPVLQDFNLKLDKTLLGSQLQGKPHFSGFS